MHILPENNDSSKKKGKVDMKINRRLIYKNKIVYISRLICKAAFRFYTYYE